MFVFLGLYLAVGAVFSAIVIKLSSLDGSDDAMDGVVLMTIWPAALVFTVVLWVADAVVVVRNRIRGGR